MSKFDYISKLEYESGFGIMEGIPKGSEHLEEEMEHE